MTQLRLVRQIVGSFTAAAVSMVAAFPAVAQTLGQGSAPEISLWRVTAALLLCLALAVAAALAMHLRMSGRLPALRGAKLSLPAFRSSPFAKLLQKGSERRLKSIETIRVSPYADICLFKCDGKTYLVAATPQGLTVLDPKVEPDPTGAL